MGDSGHSKEVPEQVVPDSLVALGMAHDVNQLLGVVLGRAQLLLEQQPGPELKRHLDLMVLATQDAASLVNEFLVAGGRDFSPESGELQPEILDLCGVVDVCREMTRDRLQQMGPAGGTGIIVQNEVAAELLIRAPAVLIREVLNNLLINAGQAMPDGGVIVVAGKQLAPELVTLSVKDPGLGMDARTLAHCCEPGFSTGKPGGYGLGLANSRRLLLGIGGDLQITSERGTGTEVTLSLPSVPSRSDVPVGQGEPFRDEDTIRDDADTPAEEVGCLRVLVVDDEESVQEMLRELLVVDGHRPTITADAASTLDVFEPGGFDLALVDLTLPGISGKALSGQLRTADPDLVIVMMSGWGNEAQIAGMDAGIVDLVTNKPIDLPKLRHVVKQARHGRPPGGRSDRDQLEEDSC